MAPPSPRRPGFSRRAQYGLFAGYVVAVVGALFGLLLVVTARVDPEGHSALQRLANDVTAPVSSATRTVMSWFGEGGEQISAYFNAATKNRNMKRELKAARARMVQADKDAAELARLKKLVGLIEAQPNRVAVTRLVSSTGASSRRFATITAGANDGVQNGMPVLTTEGLVGRVYQSGNAASRILLILDANTTIPVKRVTDNLPALINGLGDGRLEVRPLAAASTPFKVGDVFVTSGTGGIYRPGIPVAKAVQNGRDKMIARPMADPASFDIAIVEAEYTSPPPLPETDLPQGKD
jgi:rod shape-determining protein MreC